MRNICGSELREILNNGNAVIVDVRTPEEVYEGIIEGALNIDIRNQYFQERIDELEKEKHYLMVCRSGARSAQAGMYMESIGYCNVYNLEGGMMMWDGDVTRPK